MKNRKKGFTVVELVIVIAVIAILSAILIPTFVGLTDKANQAALQEDLRNSYVEYSADYADQEGYKLQTEVVLSKTAIEGASAKVYQYNTATKKWEEKQLTGTFTLLNAQAYGAYYVYSYVAAN